MANPVDFYIAIPLHGKYGEGRFTLVDGDYDGEYFSQYKWYVDTQGYAYRNEYENGRTKMVYLHHEVLRVPDGYWRDHINRNKLDNRGVNLRRVTPSQSAANRTVHKKALRTGVQQRNKKSVTYCAGKYLGSFENEIDAAIAYDKEAISRYGECAQLNFSEDSYARA